MKRSESDRAADERDDAAESSAVHHELLATNIRTCPKIDEKSSTLYIIHPSSAACHGLGRGFWSGCKAKLHYTRSNRVIENNP